MQFNIRFYSCSSARKSEDSLVIDVRMKQDFNEGIIDAKNWLNIPHYEIRKYFKLSDEDFQKQLKRCLSNK